MTRTARTAPPRRLNYVSTIRLATVQFLELSLAQVNGFAAGAARSGLPVIPEVSPCAARRAENVPQQEGVSWVDFIQHCPSLDLGGNAILELKRSQSHGLVFYRPIPKRPSRPSTMLVSLNWLTKASSWARPVNAEKRRKRSAASNARWMPAISKRWGRPRR